jgi:hypothetical protein
MSKPKLILYVNRTGCIHHCLSAVFHNCNQGNPSISTWTLVGVCWKRNRRCELRPRLSRTTGVYARKSVP